MEYVSANTLWTNAISQSNGEGEIDGRARDLECILVTGGSGLIGTNVRDILMGLNMPQERNDNKLQLDTEEYSITPTEKWVFLSSKDGDLR